MEPQTGILEKAFEPEVEMSMVVELNKTAVHSPDRARDQAATMDGCNNCSLPL